MITSFKYKCPYDVYYNCHGRKFWTQEIRNSGGNLVGFEITAKIVTNVCTKYLIEFCYLYGQFHDLRCYKLLCTNPDSSDQLHRSHVTLTHPKATKSYTGESGKCTKSEYLIAGCLIWARNHRLGSDTRVVCERWTVHVVWAVPSSNPGGTPFV